MEFQMMLDQSTESLSKSSVELVEDILNVISSWIQQDIPFGSLTPLERNHQLGLLTTNISSFVEISTLTTKYHNMTEPEFKSSHISLLFIMKGINQAFLKSDWTALDELIKYELKDNLTQWKINLIPLLKKKR